MKNEFRKTPKKQRGYIKYVDANGKATIVQASEDKSLATDITIIREDGSYEVAASVVEDYHKSRDRWVESNVRNHKIPLTKEQKAELEHWKKEHPNEEPPSSNWILSLDGATNDGDDDDSHTDKNSVMASAVAMSDHGESPELERLHEIYEELDDECKQIYSLVVIEEYSVLAASKLLKMSEPTVRRRMNSIKEKISRDPLLKKIWGISDEA